MQRSSGDYIFTTSRDHPSQATIDSISKKTTIRRRAFYHKFFKNFHVHCCGLLDSIFPDLKSNSYAKKVNLKISKFRLVQFEYQEHREVNRCL